MTTLHEEQPSLPRKHSLDILSDDTIEEQCEEGQDEKKEVTVSKLIVATWFNPRILVYYKE